MTADVINLRQARKAALRKARDAEAAENRAAHGIAKSARDAAATASRLEARNLDLHRLERSRPGDSD